MQVIITAKDERVDPVGGLMWLDKPEWDNSGRATYTCSSSSGQGYDITTAC
jgi:hypothetical protein